MIGGIGIEHYWRIECYDKDGNLKWEDEFKNLVVTSGDNKYLDATLKTGLAVPAWFISLVTGPGAGNSYVVGDTMASHAGWAENQNYSQATRPAWISGTVASGSVDNSASKAQFSITAGFTLAGGFMTDSAVKGGTSGTLLGVGNFSGGDRAVQNGDTVNVTVTCTAT